jgi:transposase, IS30 family
MTKEYKQLDLAQRYKIEAYLDAGYSNTKISVLIGVHRSTIGRELDRNIPKRGVGAKVYNALKAEQKTKVRHHEKHKHTTFTYSLKKQMQDWMSQKKFSPELVKAQWKKDNIQGVSHECMYKFIWKCKFSSKLIHKEFKNLHSDLKHGKRRRKRGNYKDSRGLIQNRVSIDKRPAIVNKRKRFGDFEADLIMGKNHKSALLVLVDRSTLLTIIERLKGKNSDIITAMIIKRMKKFEGLKTMTFDNDQAFSQHQKIAESLNIKTYFTRPYTSQDKGTIENRNGVIRQFFPKKTDFNLIDIKEIKRVETELNNRPVRKFGYLTPNQVYLSQR